MEENDLPEIEKDPTEEVILWLQESMRRLYIETESGYTGSDIDDRECPLN